MVQNSGFKENYSKNLFMIRLRSATVVIECIFLQFLSICESVGNRFSRSDRPHFKELIGGSVISMYGKYSSIQLRRAYYGDPSLFGGPRKRNGP